jgi:hypothetical protein
MSEVTHPRGGESATEKPFPAGRIPEAEGEKEEGATGAPNPRDAIVARMAEHADSERVKAIEAEGLVSREDMDPDHSEQVRKEQRSPIDDYVVVQGDKSFMRTKVDGKEVLVPMDRVRATIQKNEAAESRLQKASDWQKELSAREQQIADRERQLAQRAQRTVLPPAVADADDPDLLAGAQSVVSKLFDGNEKDAARDLAKMLSRARTPAQQTPVVIDENAIVQKAVAAVKQSDAQDAYQKSLLEGYDSFKKDYPELMADKLLFAAVDTVTEDVEKEHPEWAPIDVMREAGNRVREWANGVKPAAKTQNEDPANDRLERKRNLVPMPAAREGSPPRQAEEREQTPAEAFAEIRKQRGQPV